MGVNLHAEIQKIEGGWKTVKTTLVLVSTMVPTFSVFYVPGKGTEAIFELSRLFF